MGGDSSQQERCVNTLSFMGGEELVKRDHRTGEVRTLLHTTSEDGRGCSWRSYRGGGGDREAIKRGLSELDI